MPTKTHVYENSLVYVSAPVRALKNTRLCTKNYAQTALRAQIRKFIKESDNENVSVEAIMENKYICSE
ncbi:hypothetical protein TOT_030000459 [Theileria orientalis strain Shintoku]|uniref:Uncharacterized protein n=1 Tax=Theileria orientalis strain Shintoku TaxID=869250 RepID=J4C3X5_THEOR|nr:hypothetical protein TOT_030000459 [Theileria orientalis strain Shintoku]BAM41196.1 hypothetical protein TOT_030000459 [Theileria orientalis strain Shintoku]|eukprot:XP_009691497.1 hypothetical protein TOT_030000459 [Theileria orientalis strain Shintoku]